MGMPTGAVQLLPSDVGLRADVVGRASGCKAATLPDDIHPSGVIDGGRGQGRGAEVAGDNVVGDSRIVTEAFQVTPPSVEVKASI